MAVSEVVNFAVNGPLLAGATAPPFDIREVHDFEEAFRWATQQPPDSPSEVDWTDLRELQASQILAQKYSKARDEQVAFNQRSASLAELIQRTVAPRLRERGFHRAANEVAVDLWKIATSRLVQGRQNQFWEDVFALYKLGLWPCGWDGERYPTGKFAAFCPPKESEGKDTRP